jgi:hypothetical protein
MAALRERVVFPHLRMDVELKDNGEYLLRYGDLVQYRNGVRRVRGRELPYRFRSVEQLRYDFERDVEGA